MNPPTLFVSYSHEDETWKDRVVTHLEGLDRQAVLHTWDDRRIGGGQEWELEIQTDLQAASLAVLLVSADFLASKFITEAELPTLLDRHLRQGVRVLPLIVHPCDWKGHPWISRLQVRPTDGRPLSDGDENQVEWDVAALVAEIRRILLQAGVRVETPSFVPIPAERISVGRLPNTGSLLLGREETLARLDAAWESDTCHVLTVVAPGGVGKTALVNSWLAEMEMDHHRGALRVLAWSFYSQGAGVSKAATGDTFLNEALRWFGDTAPEEGSAWQRGERLANLIRQERTLLLLDGLEPLQKPPRSGMTPGKLKDPGIESLLKNLASDNPGLCIVTTREPVEALESRRGKTVETIDLRELSPEAGAAVLRAYDLDAPETELQGIAAAFAGHALALTLLATYLRDVHEGDVRAWKEVPLLEEDAEKGGHAFRVMKSYQDWLGKGAELEVLHLLGLFDRPASKEEIEALLAEPAIAGLTDELVKGGPVAWKRAVGRLREARLLSTEGGLGKEGGLDAHPLVRTYFGERLEKARPEAFKAGHLRLYEHLKQKAPFQPNTLEEMQPLFHAVIHGCRGGRVEEAMDEVLYLRIRRREKGYSVHKLGAIGSYLASLSGCFEHPWDRPAAGLSKQWKGIVLNDAGWCLRALGRLAEAVVPIRAGVGHGVAQEDWKEAAIRAGNLSELLLTLGRVEEAVSAARESVELADRSKDASWRMVNRTTLADALHQAGRVEKVRALFEEAEAIQAERQPQYPLLDSWHGFRYCDFLLALVSPAESGVRAVQQRAEHMLRRSTQEGHLFDIALDHITLGRTHVFLALAGGSQPDRTHLAQATGHLDRAVDGLRRAGTMHEVPRGLLARAALRRCTGHPKEATADLDEAFEIAERGEMKLHLTDAHLERARLRIQAREIDTARADVEAARRLVGETGYGRRDGEVAELETHLQETNEM